MVRVTAKKEITDAMANHAAVGLQWTLDHAAKVGGREGELSTGLKCDNS